jgi:hypothetical protein
MQPFLVQLTILQLLVFLEGRLDFATMSGGSFSVPVAFDPNNRQILFFAESLR